MTGGPVCSTCAVPLADNPRRKGTMCRSCTARAMATSDAHRQKAAAAMRRRWLTDGAHLAQAVRDGLRAKLASDEGFRARRLDHCRANGLKVVHLLNTPAGSPTRRIAAMRMANTKLSWCPIEYRDEYRRLRINGGFRARDARRIIEQQIERDLNRYVETGQLQRSEAVA